MTLGAWTEKKNNQHHSLLQSLSHICMTDQPHRNSPLPLLLLQDGEAAPPACARSATPVLFGDCAGRQVSLQPRPLPSFSQTCFYRPAAEAVKTRLLLSNLIHRVCKQTSTAAAAAAANMPRSTQEWVRMSLRTPGILIFGMVMAPCGWILDLTATVAPNWRTLHSVPNSPSDQIIEQGIWDICKSFTTSSSRQCNQQDTTYFGEQIIPIAQGLMVASLVVTLLGLAVAIPGVRCWKDKPNWIAAGLGGLLIFLSGVMTIIPIAWYTNILKTVKTVTPIIDVRVGYCIVLGYIGGIFEILGGFVMFIGICRCCGGKNRGEVRIEDVTNRQPKPAPRRVVVPSLDRARSSFSSSVPYSKDSLDDDVSFPRAKSPAARSNNTSFNGRPYDADLWEAPSRTGKGREVGHLQKGTKKTTM